jgi:hypothetical protein
MEIGPINGIRMVPAVKARPADFRLAGVFDIGDSAWASDETYFAGEKSAGGQDDEESAEAESAAADTGVQTPDDLPKSSISFFA